MAIARRPFPPDTTPEGAYDRIALAIAERRPRDAFAYLETEAQWACFTIRDLRKRACDRVRAAIRPPSRRRLLDAWREEAEAPDGPDVFVLMAKRDAWIERLERDLSGVAHVDVQGERATVVTARGTRYPFRRRDNGIWGLTIFTARAAGRGRACRARPGGGRAGRGGLRARPRPVSSQLKAQPALLPHRRPRSARAGCPCSTGRPARDQPGSATCPNGLRAPSQPARWSTTFVKPAPSSSCAARSDRPPALQPTTIFASLGKAPAITGEKVRVRHHAPGAASAMGTFTAPGGWPASNSSTVRTST